MDMEAHTALPLNDGLDREAAMMRSKIVAPLRDDIVPDDAPESEIVAHHELAGATPNADNDIESTTRDDSETFAAKDSSVILKLSVVTVGILMLTVCGYIGFLITR